MRHTKKGGGSMPDYPFQVGRGGAEFMPFKTGKKSTSSKQTIPIPDGGGKSGSGHRATRKKA